MAEIDFPNNPVVGQTYDFGANGWTWTGTTWDMRSHTTGPIDPSVSSYTHIQAVPDSVWTIDHNLGFPPGGIFTKDSAGTMIEGDVHHTSLDSLYIVFIGASSGAAYLS